MIDCGANCNYASKRMAHLLWESTRAKRNPYPVSLAAKGTKQTYVNKELYDVHLQIQKHEERLTLDVFDTKYDIVLGMQWLSRHSPVIDWRSRTLEFSNCSHGDEEDRSSSKVPVAQAIWVRPQGRMLAEMQQEIPSEYQDFEDVFTEKIGSAALPKHQPWDHEIPLLKEPKHDGWLKRLSKKEEDFLKEYIDTHLEKQFIRKSKSHISHGVLFVPKKDGTLRPCIDFRPLNDLTRKNRYPLPRIDELQDRLVGAQWYTAIDIRDAYYRVRMKEGEEWKTAFKTRWGLYEYQVMPFGLTNAPATFQELINDTLREYLDDFVLAYLDDVLIFSKTYEEHVEHVRKVLEKLRLKHLPVKLKKCEFHKERIAFLGYIVSREGLAPDPGKIKSIQDWPTPTKLKEVQGFLGLANYYRKFIKGFSGIASPLTNLTKKEQADGQRITWTKECEEAFTAIKERLTTAPILIIFDPERETSVDTDASDYAIGARLAQKGDDGKLRPVAYFSRKMTPAELNYDIHDKELLAIVEACKTWRAYLEGAKYTVQVFTDHKNLLYWTSTKELNRRQVRWSEELSKFDLRITHVRGTENGCADALSRRPDYEEGSKPQPAAILKLHKDGSLTYQRPETPSFDAISMDLTKEQQRQIIQERHDSRTAGHPGVSKTIELITRDFDPWPGLRKDVDAYIKDCELCAKSKHSRHKPYGLLMSPAMPNKSWSSIAIDFITDLPKSADPLTGTEYDSIMVVVERLTKWAYFIPFLRSAKATQLAYVFMGQVFARHGMPDEIISDRDKLFTSQFWQSLMDLLGTKHKLSTAYHPQTDGQTERTNQVLEQYLRCYLNYEQTNWVELLPTAQFAYNNSAAQTGISPFFANYGKHPKLDKEPRGLQPVADKAQLTTSRMTELHEALQSHLQEISTKTTKQANKKRIEGPTLKKGGMVYLLRKNIKTKRPSGKLDHTKLGPFRITKKLGPVNYRLALPKTMKIHDTFHVSLLEPAPRNAKTPGSIYIDKESQEPYYEVDRIIGTKWLNGKSQYLIHWKGYEHTHDTWEPEENLTPRTLQDYYRSLRRQPGLTVEVPSRPPPSR